RELEPGLLREEHRDRLPEHRGLGLAPAYAPAEHAQAVDHRRVRVRADERVGIGPGGAIGFAPEDDLAEVLEVHLMADSGGGGNHPKAVERLLPPSQERVALSVSLVVAIGVDVERPRVSE